MAAGLGFKTFTTGEVLTAADVNGYLMQGILVFANATARTSAITSPQEGQYSFLKDTNALEYYDGAAWVGAPVGDITAVTAGTGISGGGSSGAVTITNDMATTITASGDIVVGTGNGTYDNLPIGTTGQVLTADTTVSPYKVKWATAASTGGMTLLDSGTLSGASVTTASLSASYQDLRIVFRNIRPATDGAYFLFRFNADTNARYNYSNGNTGALTFTETYMGFQPQIDNGASNATAVLIVPDYANTTTWKQCYWNSLTNNSTTATTGDINRGTGVYNQTGAISSLTFFMNTGNMTSGDYYVYGVK